MGMSAATVMTPLVLGFFINVIALIVKRSKNQKEQGMYEVCDFVKRDGTMCGGLYDPNVDPPVPCLFPEEEADRCIAEIARLEPVSL